METHEAVNEIKRTLAEVQKKGQEFVHIPPLIAFLDALDKDATLSAGGRRLAQESNLEWYKARCEFDLEMFRSVIQTGQAALKTSLFINGGGAFALLAFVGNIWSKVQPAEVAQALALSLALFGGGILLAAVATGFTYLTQAVFEQKWRKTGVSLQVLTIALVIAAYVAFSFGVWKAYKALLTQLLPC